MISKEVAQGSTGFRFDIGGTTGVEEMTEQRAKSKEAYDLTGRKVAKPSKGIYIINGKKVIVK